MATGSEGPSAENGAPLPTTIGNRSSNASTSSGVGPSVSSAVTDGSIAAAMTIPSMPPRRPSTIEPLGKLGTVAPTRVRRDRRSSTLNITPQHGLTINTIAAAATMAAASVGESGRGSGSSESGGSGSGGNSKPPQLSPAAGLSTTLPATLGAPQVPSSSSSSSSLQLPTNGPPERRKTRATSLPAGSLPVAGLPGSVTTPKGSSRLELPQASRHTSRANSLNRNRAEQARSRLKEVRETAEGSEGSEERSQRSQATASASIGDGFDNNLPQEGSNSRRDRDRDRDRGDLASRKISQSSISSSSRMIFPSGSARTLGDGTDIYALAGSASDGSQDSPLASRGPSRRPSRIIDTAELEHALTGVSVNQVLAMERHLSKSVVSTHEYSDTESNLSTTRRRSHKRGRHKKTAHVSYLAPHEMLAKQQSLAKALRSLEVGGGQVVFSWMLTLIISVLTSLQVSGIFLASDEVQSYRLHLARETIQNTGSWTSGFFLLWFHTICASSIACLLVLFVANRGGGSGISDIKAFLNGNGIPDLFSFRTYLTRTFGLILVASSGIFAGSEGPSAHIGAITARSILRFAVEKAPFRPRGMSYGHRSDCEFVAQGVAIGIASAFGAPVGGILFAFEEASSFWSKNLTWRSFVGCMLAAAVGKASAVGFTDLPVGGFIQFPDSDVGYDFWELMPFALIASCTGLVGAFFCMALERMTLIRGRFYSRRGERRQKLYRFLEVFAMATITSIVVFWVPVAAGCHPLSQTSTAVSAYNSSSDSLSNDTSASLATDTASADWELGSMSQTICPPGQYSGLAVLLLDRKEAAIMTLFANKYEGEAFFKTSHLVIGAACCICLVLLTFGTSIPAGLFVPNILLGACIGRAAGQIVSEVLELELHTGVYALVGCAGMIAGYSRMTISLSMIMLELTQSTTLLLPVVMSILVSKSVADFFKEESAYDIGIMLHQLGSITILRGGFDEGDVPVMRLLTAHDACSVEVQALKCEETTAHIMAIIVQTRFSGFPLISSTGGGEVVGLIRRERLLEALKDHEQGCTLGDRMSQVVPSSSSGGGITSTTNASGGGGGVSGSASTLGKNSTINLLPYADQTPEVKHWNTPLERTFRHFAAAGLRHLCLVDEMHRLVGILTRSDLAPLCHPRTRESSARFLLMRKQAALPQAQPDDGEDTDTDDWTSQATSFTTDGTSTPLASRTQSFSNFAFW